MAMGALPYGRPAKPPGRWIRIELQELRKHIDHHLEVDHGRANLQGEVYRYEYTVWCKTCDRPVGNTIQLKEDEA